MAPLETMALLLGSLVIIGGVFAYQYKLSLHENPKKIFMLPLLLLLLYFGLSIAATVSGNQYTAKEFTTVDRFGNTLELTVQLPKSGSGYAGSFSPLRIYDDHHVLLDELGLYYKNNVAEDLIPSKYYEPYVHKMLQNVKLDGVSQSMRYVLKGIGFLGITMTKNPFLVFAIPFGILIGLLMAMGILTRKLQARRIRIQSMNKIDIQSFQSSSLK